ncbi:GDSL-type esterase/lipase family protein [Streptomyces sp. HNM0574]|uniref:GDSL-type esterase/lipase family protein n=1 Tax=Streptomyces sp. HNM0574 TaxID=2714954 RepID=UPI003217B47C
MGKRALAIGSGALALLLGLTLAAACGSPGGGAHEGRDQPSARPSDAQSHSSPGPHSPSAAHSPSSTTGSRDRSGWDTSPDSLAAVGDSITRGFDACSLLSDCTAASWATGSDDGVRSLAGRLLDDPAAQSWNYAVSGSTMAGLASQMKRAAARDPDLVTVMTGANDACRPDVEGMTSVPEFREGFRRALRTLWDERPDAQVYVASVPDLKRLWSVGRDSQEAQRAWKFGICRSMLDAPRSVSAAATERRDRVRERVIAYNGVLREECAEHTRCRYDNGAVFSYRFTERELSPWDWFHPGRAGQRELAALAHREIVSPRP